MTDSSSPSELREQAGSIEPIRAAESGAGSPRGDAPLFAAKPAERVGLPMKVWVVAVAIVVIAIAAMVFAGRSKAPAAPTTLQPQDAYATSLPLSQLAMSESTSISGGKLTYLDGHIKNLGSRTLTGATLQVVFLNDEGLPPHIEVVPLTVIRMRQPYIDTGPVGAAPLRPGQDQEFRLIFESVPPNWNMQMPEVRIVRTELTPAQ